MKKLIYLFILFSFISCDVNNIPLNLQPGFTKFYFQDTVNYYLLKSGGLMYLGGSLGKYDSNWVLNSEYKANIYNTLPEGKIVIAGREIVCESFYSSFRDINSELINKLSNLNDYFNDSNKVYGNNSLWGFKTKPISDYYHFIDTLRYTSKFIILDSILLNSNELSLKNNNEIKWEVDSNCTNKVCIIVSNENFEFHSVIDDKGNYKFPINLMPFLKIGSNIKLKLLRYNINYIYQNYYYNTCFITSTEIQKDYKIIE